ncbi:hypothetical protein OCGS_1921 [Oceaniovalibus guishaninsula JLT2003]|uniref:Copper chaperone PCu(A)C n=1 Tax=Oceaniovalibus guishaninsula JLT2003 TaxID=1231392 RepID=K2I4U2_9RHOB|nr:copper chaperone PCu(A)C [Oceaniovalibus guishaninsula]EKE43940.1 hypothetical protein OCGS_1921 [Oceaniovalibus guishaninsula JLT2003]
MTLLRSALAAAFLALPIPALAHDFAAGDLAIGHPMILETTPVAKSAGGYLTVTNNGDTPDRLIGIEGDIAKLELHETVSADGIARMEPRPDGFEIAPGETLTLARGGKHVMFMGLQSPLSAGDTVDAVLIFRQAGRVPVTFDVEAPGDGAAMDHGGMDHGAPTN